MFCPHPLTPISKMAAKEGLPEVAYDPGGATSGRPSFATNVYTDPSSRD